MHTEIFGGYCDLAKTLAPAEAAKGPLCLRHFWAGGVALHNESPCVPGFGAYFITTNTS